MIEIIKEVKDLFLSTVKNGGTYLAIVGSIVTIVTIRSSAIIELRWLIVAGIIIFTFLNSAYKLVKKRNQEIEQLKTEMEEIKKSAADAFRFHVKAYDRDGEKDLFYIEYSEYLPEDTIVTIYYNKTNSKMICAGRVLDVEPKSYTTVEVIPETVKDGREQLLNEIKTNTPDILKKVHVRLLVKNESVMKLVQQKGGNESGEENKA